MLSHLRADRGGNLRGQVLYSRSVTMPLPPSGCRSPASNRTSLASRIAMTALRLVRFKRATLGRMHAGLSFAPSLATRPRPPAGIRIRLGVGVSEIGRRRVYTLGPQARSPGQRVLYLHGGAYSVSFTSRHWSFMAWLAKATGSTVIAPDYPLSQDSGWRETFSMVRETYGKLAAGAGGQGVIVMGDSAGGGLALALAQSLRQDRLPQPTRLFLLSPWLDVTMGNPEIPAVEPGDPVLGTEALRMAGRRYAGADDPAHALISPLFGNLTDLAPITLFTGTADILNPDARKLRDIMESYGLSLDYHEFPGMMHDWMLFGFPESAKARREILLSWP